MLVLTEEEICWEVNSRSPSMCQVFVHFNFTSCIKFFFQPSFTTQNVRKHRNLIYPRPYIIIRILSSTVYHPHFVIRVFPSAFFFPHLSIRILSSTFFLAPSAIRSALDRDPNARGASNNTRRQAERKLLIQCI